MFEVGFTELLLISVLALVVLGPERLPRVAAQVGRWMGRARTMARQFREQLEEEASLEAARRPRPSPGSATSDTHSPSANPSPAPDVQPPEVVASAPAHEIDSNDTRHADLSETPAAPVQPDSPDVARSTAAGQTHERGT